MVNESEVGSNGASILIIDDEPIARDSLLALLGSEGYRLLTAENGIEGLQILEKTAVDMVLLDIMLPGINGFDVCRRIRNTPGLVELPVVMVTALDDRESRLRGLLMGADDFLTKPYDGDELRARVRTITRLNRYRRLMEQSERLAYLQDYDPLTDLPNRNLMHSSLMMSLDHAKRLRHSLAVLVIEIDDSSRIHATLGQQAGDHLIKDVALRLNNCVQQSDMIGRVGENRFVVLHETNQPIKDVSTLAQAIHIEIAKPFHLVDEEVFIKGSIGISLFPADGETADALLQNAAAASRRARRHGRGHYEFFAVEMNVAAIERLQLETQLRHALERGEFRLYYQPKINLTTGRVNGVEALVRWEHPVRGLVPPGQFIGLAEDTGLIEPIGAWVMQEACRQAREWLDKGLSNVRVAVNVSSKQFRLHDLALDVQKVSKYFRLPEGVLEIELTESLLMPSSQDGNRHVLSTLYELKEAGVYLSIDDFGTGYSSLSYLHRFPVDALKVDRSFIQEITTDADDAVITTSIIDLAHNLRLKVVAEGVENEQQLEWLRKRDCDEIQGYFYSPPVPADEVEKLWREFGTAGQAGDHGE